MEALKFCILAATLTQIAAFSKEARTGALHIPEKILGGVIEIVQSHKNKPLLGTQNYQNIQQTQQIPQYQQWNGQTNQNQLQQSQLQVQTGGQYASGFQHGYTQGSLGTYNPGSTQNYPTRTGPVGSQGPQGFNQAQNVGQYQGGNIQFQANNQQAGYQGQNWNGNQYQQANQGGQQYLGNQIQGQYVSTSQNSQGSNQYQGQSGQSSQNVFGNNHHQNGQYGQNQYQNGQNSQNQYQNGQFNQNQYQNGQFNQNEYQNGQFHQNQYQNGQFNQNQNQNGQIDQQFQTTGNQFQGSQMGHGGGGQGSLIAGQQVSGNGQGPACVCQAWTKPTDVLNDAPATEKKDKTLE